MDTSLAKTLKNKQNVDRTLVLIALLGIILLAAALRINDLGTESYSNSEVATVHMAQRSIQDILLNRWGQPPLYTLLAHFWMQVFGTSETATRSLSALAGIASIPLMYAVGRELLGRKVGLISSLLMAISEFQIFYSQDFRYYPLFVLMTLFSYLFYIRALKSGERGHFVLYALATILLLYAHTFAMYAVAAQGLYFLLEWRRHRRLIASWFLSQTLILLGFAPGLVLGIEATGTHILDWIGDVPLWRPLLVVARYVFPLTSIYGRHYLSWRVLAAGMAFLGIGIVLFIGWKGKEQWLASVKGLVPDVKALLNRGNELLLLSCWFLCPIVLPYVVSKLVMPAYNDQYTISAAPALYLLLALGIVTLRQVVPELVLLGALVVWIAPGLQDYYATDVKEQWRESAAYVTETSQPGDAIVFAPDYVRDPFDWYYRGGLPECVLEPRLNNYQTISAAFAKCTAGAQRVWVILVPNHVIVDQREFFLEPSPQQMRLERNQEFTGISVYLFTLPIERTGLTDMQRYRPWFPSNGEDLLGSQPRAVGMSR